MKRFTIYIFLITIILFTGISSCRSTQKISDSYSNYKFETSIVATSPSGMVTVRTWGTGPDKDSAIREALKNAVADMIFKGIKGGGNNYTTQPIVTEVNARERYANYFDPFFATNGEYKKFVTETSKKDGSRTESKSAGRVMYGITATIDRSALVSQLKEDGIINRTK